jgi:hypothetical protein
VNDRQATICLHDYIPGIVSKIGFNQVSNEKVVFTYRILKDAGYFYRMRVYDLKNIQCK